MRLPSIARTWLLIVACACAGAGEARSQTVAQLFDADTLQDVNLYINVRDLAQLHANYKDNTYYPAELVWRGLRVRNIGVRARGTGSRNPIKPGLQVDFNRYVGGQTFLGLKALVLDNLWQDPALIRERTAMALFTRLGRPAPREAFARLFVNDEYQGVYAVVEAIDSVFAARAFADPEAYIFEYHWVQRFYAGSLGDALPPYEALFEARTHERESETVLYGPIRDLFERIDEPDGAAWRASVEQYVDLEDFITTVAVEKFTSEVDGLIGYAGMNNFYLYRPAGSTRHQVIVWDRDNAFQETDPSVLLRADENVLFRKAMTYVDLRALFFATLDRCARLSAQNGWLEAEIVRSATIIDAAVREDLLKQFSDEEFDAGVRMLVEFARTRPQSVLRQVQSLR